MAVANSNAETRDEKRGIDALEKLKKDGGFSNEKVLFHKLDVADPSSVESLAKFINSQFGKLDILVNNAGIGGIHVGVVSVDSKASQSVGPEAAAPNLWEHATQDYESANEGIQINYYGAKRMIEAFVPLLQKSKSP